MIILRKSDDPTYVMHQTYRVNLNWQQTHVLISDNEGERVAIPLDTWDKIKNEIDKQISELKSKPA